jgi:hypothetical protein
MKAYVIHGCENPHILDRRVKIESRSDCFTQRQRAHSIGAQLGGQQYIGSGTGATDIDLRP